VKKLLKLIILTALMVLVFTSCADPRFEVKELIVKNNTADPITGISIMAEDGVIDSRIIDYPTIIAPGAQKSYAILTPASNARLFISTQVSDKTIRFTYDHLVDGKNEAITAEFTEVDSELEILLSGSNAEETPIS
jgi:hypothetical protein